MEFDHERLDVYRTAIEFAAWTGELLDGPLRGCRQSPVTQLDRASTSIALNIAEGNGKRSHKDRCRYLDTARGSALESAACLDVLIARRLLEGERTRGGKVLLKRVVEMLTKLTQALIGEPSGIDQGGKRGGGNRPELRDQWPMRDSSLR